MFLFSFQCQFFFPLTPPPPRLPPQRDEETRFKEHMRSVHIEAALPSERRYKRRICKGIKMLIIQAGCKSCFKPHEICMALCEPYAGRIVALTCHREEQGSFYALLRECGFNRPTPQKIKKKRPAITSPH